MINLQLRELLNSGIQRVFPDTEPMGIEVVPSTDLSHGDFSSNVALTFVGRSLETAQKIVAEIKNNPLPEYLDDVTVAGPGFINFKLSRNFFTHVLAEILREGKRFGGNASKTGQDILVEYTDPNPFKEFHIGHLMPNVIGESLARLYECAGAQVERMSYQGDVGLHVAKALYGIKENRAGMPEEGASLAEKTKFLGQAYAAGSRAYEEHESAKSEIQAINKQVFGREDAELNTLYDIGRRWSLEHFEELYRVLGTKFNHYVFESEVASRGKELVRANLGKVFEESDGAVVYKGEKVGLHTRVFITSEGLPTYEAKEVGLAEKKFSIKQWSRSVTVTANEQNGFFAVTRAAISELWPDIGLRMEHIGHGLLRFATGKMSSRTGNVITGESLIEDVRGLVREKMKESDIPPSERALIEDIVAIGAIKFSILRQATGKDIIFDFEKSLSFEGDSGPYLQYTAVRAKSVLGRTSAAPALTAIPEDMTVLPRLLTRFPGVVERAAAESAPQHIVTYLLDLASAFNAFYAQVKILDSSTEEPYRLALTEAVATVLERGLALLGIRVPEQM